MFCSAGGILYANTSIRRYLSLNLKFFICLFYVIYIFHSFEQTILILILSIIKDFLLRKTGAYKCDEYILRFVKEYINDNFHHRFDKKKMLSNTQK